jgi:hypothetical protein
MGMRLFYVTVFVFFLGGGGGVAIGRFAVFFKGGSGKTAFFMWCFCGESMVDCVVMVERRHHVLERLKTCHEFEVYFCIGVETAVAIPFREQCTHRTRRGPLFARIAGLFSL